MFTQNSSSIDNNMLPTQQFTIDNKWYTRIFYRGGDYGLGKHKNLDLIVD